MKASFFLFLLSFPISFVFSQSQLFYFYEGLDCIGSPSIVRFSYSTDLCIDTSTAGAGTKTSGHGSNSGGLSYQATCSSAPNYSSSSLLASNSSSSMNSSMVFPSFPSNTDASVSECLSSNCDAASCSLPVNTSATGCISFEQNSVLFVCGAAGGGRMSLRESTGRIASGLLILTTLFHIIGR